MTLEELKAAFDKAKAEAEASPKDAKLQNALKEAEEAYNVAKKKADEEGDPEPDPEDPELKDSKLDDKTKAYLAKLRKENAAHRTKAKDLASKLKVSEEQKKAVLKAVGIEPDGEAPEEKIKKLTSETQTQAFRNAVLERAIEHGIAKDDLEFFEFSLNKAVGALGEGEELADEKIEEIAAAIKKRSKNPANTSVGKGKGGKEPPPGESDEITLGQFLAMGVLARSELYTKSPDLYAKLVAQAKAEKKRLV